MEEKNDTVTLLIVDEEATKTYQVKKIVLQYFQQAMIIMPLAVLLLMSSLLVLGWRHYVNVQALQEATAQLEDLQLDFEKVRIAKSAEIEDKIEKLNDSEKAIARLENYLISRGIKIDTINTPGENSTEETNDLIHPNNDSVGGPVSDESIVVPYTETYSKEVKDLLDIAREVPIGRPHNGTFSSLFGVRSNPFNSTAKREYHSGLDIRGKIGDAIRVTADGKVDFAGVMGGYGNVVRVVHGFGYSTLYAHLSKIEVSVGQEVKAGALIGLLGTTGRSTGPHVHYEVRFKGVPTNPVKFLTL